MTTELEQEFFKVFGIEPIEYRKNVPCLNFLSSGICNITDERCNPSKCNEYRPDKTSRLWRDFMEIYPEITDHKLLQLLCIYNDMQGCIELCITPCKYEDVKEMILSTLVNEKFAMIDCEKGTYMDVMTKQIQQLFKEEE